MATSDCERYRKALERIASGEAVRTPHMASGLSGEELMARRRMAEAVLEGVTIEEAEAQERERYEAEVEEMMP